MVSTAFKAAVATNSLNGNKSRDLSKTKKPLSSASSNNFELTESGGNPGVYFIDHKGLNMKICSLLRIVAETHAQDGSHYGRLLEWTDSKDRLHRFPMPMEMVHSQGTELAKYLASRGLEIMPSRKHHEKLACYIATAPTDRTMISTNKMGWHGQCFVLPGETIGLSTDEIVYQTEYHGYDKFGISGTLEEWKTNISRFCTNNFRLQVAVSSAFAAPLLSITNSAGGGLHFRGPTSSGKTTVLYAAGSVWGGNGEFGYLETWKSTSNGLEVTAAMHNHALLCLDEIGECDSREVGSVAYMLANGRGKGRMTKMLRSQPPFSWRLLFLSTGEHSLSDKMSETGTSVKGGQEIRLCEIPAGGGKYEIFDDLHGLSTGQVLSDQLSSASRQFYGTAIRDYLKWLVTIDFAEVRARWNEFLVKFKAEAMAGVDYSPEVGRVANMFALIAFGGELATEAGVTGWAADEAYQSAQRIFRLWLDGRDGPGRTDAETAVRQVRAFLEKNGSSAFQPVSLPDQKVVNRAGFVRGRSDEYLILPEAFRRDVCKGLDYRFVAEVLAERGYLEGKGSTVVHLSADLGKTRVYVVKNMLSASDEVTEVTE